MYTLTHIPTCVYNCAYIYKYHTYTLSLVCICIDCLKKTSVFCSSSAKFQSCTFWQQAEVSKKWGTAKHPCIDGFSIVNHPFGVSAFMEKPKCLFPTCQVRVVRSYQNVLLPSSFLPTSSFLLPRRTSLASSWVQ